ncbi:hypothetical protein [Alsobacter sp. SYSU BS001988]
MSAPGVLLVPYGADQWSLSAIRCGRTPAGALRVCAPFPCVAIEPAAREPLRLNNAPYALGAAAAAGSSPLQALRAHVRHLCRPWDRLSHRFLDAYFDHLEASVAADMDALRRRAEPFAGLFAPEDWIYSAPRPLPRAHLAAPEAAPTGTEADHVQADVAFWLGDRFAAALSTQSGLTPARGRARAERLARAGVRVVAFSAADLARPEPLFDALLGGPVARFWAAEPIPCGPFRPPAVDG